MSPHDFSLGEAELRGPEPSPLSSGPGAQTRAPGAGSWKRRRDAVHTSAIQKAPEPRARLSGFPVPWAHVPGVFHKPPTPFREEVKLAVLRKENSQASCEIRTEREREGIRLRDNPSIRKE